MTSDETWHRGADIPAEGDPVTVALCLPDTWKRVIAGLLVEPTKPYFWRNDADETDREAAVAIAEGILATFDTEDCPCEEIENNCDPYPATNHDETFDFTADEYGWVGNADLCQRTDGIGFEAIKFYNPLGYWTKAVEISFDFPSPFAMPTQIYVTGNQSVITYPLNGPQTFPFSELYLWATDGSYPIMQARTTYGVGGGLPPPVWLTWQGLPRTLASKAVLVYHAGNYLVEATADQAIAVIESVHMVWND